MKEETKKQMYKKKFCKSIITYHIINLLIVFPTSESSNYNNTISILKSITFVDEINDNVMDPISESINYNYNNSTSSVLESITFVDETDDNEMDPISESINYDNSTISVLESITFVDETDNNGMGYNLFNTIQQPTKKTQVIKSSLSLLPSRTPTIMVDTDDDYNILTEELDYNYTQPSSSTMPSSSTFPSLMPQNTSTIIPSISLTANTPKIISQSFIQSYCGTSTLNFMTPYQISSYMIVLQLLTSRYAIGQPLVDTKADFLSQHLFIIHYDDDSASDSSNACSLAYSELIEMDENVKSYSPTISPKIKQTEIKELRVKFIMTWSSSITDIHYMEYVYNFTTYMNLPQTKILTTNQLNQLGVLAQYASNVRISFNKPTVSPTLQPTTEQPTMDPNNNNQRTKHIILGSVFGISIFVIITSIVFIIFFHPDYFLKIKSYFFNHESLTDDQRIDRNSEEDVNDKITSNDNNNNSKDVVISMNNYNDTISSNPNNDTISTTATTSTMHTATDNSLYYNNLNRNSVMLSPQSNNNTNESVSTNISPSFLLKQNNNSMNDELDIYYKNESLEKFRYKLQTYLHLFDDDSSNDNEIYCNDDDNTIISYSITNVLLMNDHDCIHILNTIGCYIMNDNVTINEFELEANMLYKSYHWLKRNSHNISNNDNYEEKRKEYIIGEILQPIIICVLYKILTINASVHVFYECCTVLLQKDLLKSNDNNISNYGKKLLHNNSKTIIVTGMRKNVNIFDIISTFQNFGNIDYIALASLSRDFGFVKYNNEHTSNIILQKFRRSEIIVQDVAVVVKFLSSYVKTSSPIILKDDDNYLATIPQDKKNKNDNIMHILSENSSSCMKSLLKMNSGNIRNISSGSHNSAGNNNNPLIRKSTSWPNKIDELNDDDEDEDINYPFNDTNTEDDDQYQQVHLMQQLNMFNPYI